MYADVFSGFTATGVLQVAGAFIAALVPIVLATKVGPKVGARMLSTFLRKAS